MAYTAQLTEAASDFHERLFPGYVSDFLRTDPEFIERFDNFAFDEVVSTGELSDRTRMLCWLATLLGCQGIDEFRGMVNAALNMGVEPEAIQEVVYQATAYLGIGRVFPFLKAKNELFEARGIMLPLANQATTTPDEASRYETDARLRRPWQPRLPAYRPVARQKLLWRLLHARRSDHRRA